MKSFKTLVITLLAAAAALVSTESAAWAAGTYGGAGSPVSLSYYNSTLTGFLPGPPGGISPASTITGVNYTLNWSSPGYQPGYMAATICSNTAGVILCTSASQFTNSTTAFNGKLVSTTQLYFKLTWSNATTSGLIINGPVKVTDSVTVNYT